MSGLPNGWVRAPLAAIADVLDHEREPINSSEREARINGKLSTDLYPYYGATGQVGLIDSFRSDGQRVLLGEDAAPFLDQFKDKAYLANGRFWVNNHAHVLAGAAGLVDNRFLCFQLNTVDYHQFVTGSTRLKLTSSAMKQIPMALAPAAEQTRIVEKLEELLSDLDAGVAELKAAQKKLAQYRQSLLKAAVEGALTAAWRQQHPPAETGAQLLQRILTERRARWEARQLAKFKEQGKTPPKDWQKKYPEPVRPDTSGLPELPQGWVWASVEQLAELVSGHTPRDAATVSTQDGVVPWFKVSDMNQPGNEEWMSSATVRFSREVAESLGMKIMPAGTIIFPKRGGAIATNKKRKLGVDACYDLNTMGLVPVKTISDWLWTWFIGVDLGRLVDGAIIPQINNPDIAPLCVPIPPSSEQQEIISVVNQQIEAVGNQANAVELSLKQSSAQRQNILRAAFAGQLVPQDPADEPASVLLERIRAERAARETPKKPRGRPAKEAA